MRVWAGVRLDTGGPRRDVGRQMLGLQQPGAGGELGKGKAGASRPCPPARPAAQARGSRLELLRAGAGLVEREAVDGQVSVVFKEPGDLGHAVRGLEAADDLREGRRVGAPRSAPSRSRPAPPPRPARLTSPWGSRRKVSQHGQ